MILIASHSKRGLVEGFRFLGWWPIGLIETGKSILLTAIPISGLIYKSFVMDQHFTSTGVGYQEALRGQVWGIINERNVVSTSKSSLCLRLREY
jgi:hypothetical protein